MLSLASASEIAGTKAIDNEFVIKEGKNNNGIANPVSLPYGFVAFCTVTPAYVRLWATIIGSKKCVSGLTNLLPVCGMAIENKSFPVCLLSFKFAKNLRRTFTTFFPLNK